MEQQYEDGDGDGDKPLTLNRSEQSYNKLMKSPSFTEAEKQLMMRIRNTKMTPRLRAALLSRSGLARKVANMLGINKSVVQTPKARMRIANNIYTRVNAKKKIIVTPIGELSQKDLDASTSLFVVRVNQPGYVRDPRDIKISGKDQWGRDFSNITAQLNIELQFDYNKSGDRKLASIVRREAGGFSGCIYFVLNAESIDEAAQHIAIYANTMGGYNSGYGKVLPNFCAEMDLAKLARKYNEGGPSMPRNVSWAGRKSGKRRTRRTDAKRY